MREEEERMALYSMADAHAAVRPIGWWAAVTARSDDRQPRPPNRTARGRNHPLGRALGMSGRSDGRVCSPSDPADVPAAAWNGTRQAICPIGRPLGDFHRPADRITVASGGRLECCRIPRMGPTDRTAPPLIVR